MSTHVVLKSFVTNAGQNSGVDPLCVHSKHLAALARSSSGWTKPQAWPSIVAAEKLLTSLLAMWSSSLTCIMRS